MLKWAVYKKNQDGKTSTQIENEEREPYIDGPCQNQNRRSLDCQTVKKSKKPTRYQRRSLGSAARRNNAKIADKENINYIGNTPNYYKEGFVKKTEFAALKDVSNITPNGTPKNFDRRRFCETGTKEDVPPDLPATPPSYSRNVREAKKRKLEMASSNSEIFRRDSCAYKSERRIKPVDRSQLLSPKLSHSTSEPSLNELSDRLSATTTSSRHSIALGRNIKNNPVCTTKATSEGLVEIEYEKDLVINCIEKPMKPVVSKDTIAKTTLPIFGHHIFMENPLYFNKNETAACPFKRTRRKSNEFESSFKSPSVDKKDTHALVRDACSPAPVTPLSAKLAALRFSTLSTHSKSQRKPFVNDITEFFPKIENPFAIPLRDEESSRIEMENKFILGKDSVASVTESTVSTTVSTTQMGDVTLEKMIEDIIKSTKIVKSKRRILNGENNNNHIIEYEKPTIESAKALFVNPQAENKSNLIKEAKYVNLSRENSISPKHSPTKKMPVQRVNEKLLKNLPIGCFILDDGDGYNEREVRTPDVLVDSKSKSRARNRSNKLLNRSQSMKEPNEKCNIQNMSIESIPDIYSAAREANLRLRRQRCIRRKKSTVSNESCRSKVSKPETSSMLTLEMGIPSPLTELQDVSLDDPSTASYPYIPPPVYGDYRDQANTSIRSNVSHSSLMPDEDYNQNKRSRELFGITLENGIPSPITPVPSLKRPSNALSDERAHKSSKLDEEFLPPDTFTPVIEHKSSRRCLTFSPEECSINSNEEKRRSVASNRLERSSDKFGLKGTIDLEIKTRNDVIDVHVIRCRELQRPSGRVDDINAYAKVVISGVAESQSLPSQRSIFQRTSVLYGKREPEFQRHLKLPIPAAMYDHQSLHISVWHRDKKYRRSEFLGCVSFPLKDAIKGDVSGTYFLQGAVGPGRPITDRCSNNQDRLTERKMATDNVETATGDGVKESHNDKAASANGPTSASTQQSMVAAFQKEADEHLFLRYLELDPSDDPTAPKRTTQRGGATPFTTTRKLVRGAGGGFGFTVVWTRPPRVERVAAGGSAERAGLRSGDYIVFVGTKNVVMSNEDEIRGLVKSAGQALTMETFRRVPQNGAGNIGMRPRAQSSIPAPESTPPPPPRSPRATTVASPATQPRPATACSSTSQSLDRRKLHLPQVTFSKETPGVLTDGRKRALLSVVSREQHYATCLQFGLVRFVSPLAERADLIAPSDHQLLFQNIEEIFRLSEDILDQVVQEDGEMQTSTIVGVYLQKTPLFLSLYKKYCLGLKRADCVLVKKSKDPSGAFSRFCTSPPIPRRRPDITSLMHKPLEQFRELLRLMKAAAASHGAGPYDHLEKKQLQAIVDQLQVSYQDVTAGSGLMGLAGDGKPLLSVADLESRLVFTRCKPFVLNTPGRQWIFGGELFKVEGRSIRPYWALLFSDLLLFTTVSRDRVLFVTEEPVALTTVSEGQFNVRKKATEFRLVLGRAGGESPLISCSLRTPGRTKSIVLRAPSIDLKAVWQSLLQRQIYRAHTMSGTPLGSPLDSPDPQLTFSLATLDSQPRQTRRSSQETQTGACGSATEGARSSRRGSSLHLQRWMTQLPETDELDPPEADMEMWSVEELRKRSKELNLLEVVDLIVNHNDNKGNSPGDKKENDKSPSKSSNSGSQITVRTSPVVVDTIPICRQCHKKCLSKPNSPLISQKDPPIITNKPKQEIPSPQNSNSNKSSTSACSANCGNRKSRNFSHLERKGAIRYRPEDAPKAAAKVIDSIEQSQKMLKSTSYELKTDSPILNRSTFSGNNTKSHLELRNGSIRSPSPSSSSRNNSPFSTSHTTCSSMVFNSSSNDLRMSSSNIANNVQCVIAQEKYLNEVKCAESIVLSKIKTPYSNSNIPSPIAQKNEQTRQKTENVFNKVLGYNFITKKENTSKGLKTSANFLEDDSVQEKEAELNIHRGMRRSPRMGISSVSHMNGDVSKLTDNSADNNFNFNGIGSKEDFQYEHQTFTEHSNVNTAAHLTRVETYTISTGNDSHINRRPNNLESKSESPVPNIAVVPPTPDYFTNKTDNIDDSPDSPDAPEDLPYVSLKRYGTMSSLERLPSDETDDGSIRLTQDQDNVKPYNPATTATGGIMGWTARAGSFVVEKMNIFSYTESVANTSQVITKQPTFLERCLGVSDWKSALGTDDGTIETGEGSGASGEDAWGTPSSGDLSDNLPDSEHGTLSSPTKSSSSYAGDDDTDLMMDELLMAPTITGPTTLRPLLPRDVFRRRLEPLLEEEFSDSGSEENKPTANNNEQGSVRCGADDCFGAPPRPPSVSEPETEYGGAGVAAGRGGDAGGAELSPDRTPTNEMPFMPSPFASKECTEARAGAAGAGGRRGSASSASTPSTLERTTIHNPTPLHHSPVSEQQPSGEELKVEEQRPLTPERLSPRAEMRLALDQGRDLMADQEVSWGGGSDHWSFRAACQRQLLRRVSSADAVTLCRAPPRRTVPHTTSRSSVYAWKLPENEGKSMEMEELARAEVRTMRSRTRSQCQNGKILGFLRRRASSDSPRREPLVLGPVSGVGQPRPFSPRRASVSNNNGYYKICFVNGYV